MNVPNACRSGPAPRDQTDENRGAGHSTQKGMRVSYYDTLAPHSEMGIYTMMVDIGARVSDTMATSNQFGFSVVLSILLLKENVN